MNIIIHVSIIKEISKTYFKAKFLNENDIKEMCSDQIISKLFFFLYTYFFCCEDSACMAQRVCLPEDNFGKSGLPSPVWVSEMSSASAWQQGHLSTEFIKFTQRA